MGEGDIPSVPQELGAGQIAMRSASKPQGPECGYLTSQEQMFMEHAETEPWSGKRA